MHKRLIVSTYSTASSPTCVRPASRPAFPFERVLESLRIDGSQPTRRETS
jgi:hypothetical protein